MLSSKVSHKSSFGFFIKNGVGNKNAEPRYEIQTRS